MIKCLIIDDEPIARQIIRGYASHMADIEIAGECENAIQALELLQKIKIDLLFLDINMPVLNGIAFLKTLSSPPTVIITSAYQEYALDGYELSVADYLLKPFSLERFIKAINKVKGVRQLPPSSQTVPAEVPPAIFIKAENKVYRFETNSILYCEAQGNYTKVVTDANVVEAYISLTKVEEQLQAPQLIRCHRSFVVNTKFVTAIEGNRLNLGNIEIPIGSSYRAKLFAALGLPN